MASRVMNMVDAHVTDSIDIAVIGGDGIGPEVTAEALKVSEATVARDWRLAKTWLLREIASHD